MSNLEITTDTLSEDILLPKRTVRIGDKAISTPAKAIPVRKTREHEQVHGATRGVSELYCEVDAQKLKKERRGATAIRDHLRRGANKTRDGELTATFVSYTDTMTLPVIDAAFLVEVQRQFSDVLTVPMMPQLARSVDEAKDEDEATQDASYQSYKKSVLRFLDQAEERAPNMPVMGMLPRLGWDFTRDLLDVYAAHDIRAYALNFDRREITAASQVSVVSPLMNNIAGRGIEEHVLFYAINLSPGQREAAIGARPASDFASVGMGFDIIGGTHEAPRMPAEVFEQDEEEDEEITFRLFDKEDYVRREAPIDRLPEVFPDDSALDGESVAERVKASPNNAKFRLQKLVNAEQMGMALNALRNTENVVLETVSSKPGMTEKSLSACQDVRESFDDEYFQSGLSDF
ncbi:hypothetical protein U3A55_10420 [Salarchaeum sp. III]|uniref:hypothetical protein n=1 Tax=Salarchaeum sp. III TaxID=3107927 RepID=UPI002EDB6375